MTEKLKETINIANQVYHLTGTMRYNNQFMLRQENVAEHSYMVSAIVHILCEQYEIDDKTHFEALKYAIIHDMPEAVTGDILASTKSWIPELPELLSELELKIVDGTFPFLSKTYHSLHHKENELAYVILKLADYLSVQVCMEREERLGNRQSFVHTILYDVGKKIDLFYEKFNELRGSSQNV